jgi:predicted metalloprotease with PDZ domain
MSEEAPFADMGLANDPDDRNRTFISYYTYGGAIALGLDLAIREQSGGRLSLDDYMRRLWIDFGKPADPRPGYVVRPYTLADLRAELGTLTGDRAFADAIFDKDVQGRDVFDYAHLLSLAGYVVRPATPTRGWIGDVAVTETSDGLVVGTDARGTDVMPVPFGTPAYDAGLDESDVVISIAGQPATMRAWQALSQSAPGTRVVLGVRRRGGDTVSLNVTLGADPRLQILPVENTGGTLASQQRAFRDAWLGAKGR